MKEKQPGKLNATTMPRGVLLYLLLMSFLSPMAVAVFGVWYSGNSQKRTEHKFSQQQFQSDERWCDLMQGLDQPPAPPAKIPLTPRQVAIQRTLHKLRLDLHC